MVEGGNRLRLPPKSLERAGRARKIGRKEFERNLPAQADILRAVDHAHATTTDPIEHAVVGDDLTLHRPDGLSQLPTSDVRRPTPKSRKLEAGSWKPEA